MSKEQPFSRGVTDACLNLAGNLSSEKDRLARCAMISPKTDLQRIMREVGNRDIGHKSMLEDFGGEELSTLRTSSAVTGDSVLRTDP